MEKDHSADELQFPKTPTNVWKNAQNQTKMEATPKIEPTIAAKKTQIRVDWFIAGALSLDIEVDEKTYELLVAEAAMFLSSAGTLNPDRWALLSTQSKIIFNNAMQALAGGRK